MTPTETAFSLHVLTNVLPHTVCHSKCQLLEAGCRFLAVSGPDGPHTPNRSSSSSASKLANRSSIGYRRYETTASPSVCDCLAKTTMQNVPVSTEIRYPLKVSCQTTIISIRFGAGM